MVRGIVIPAAGEDPLEERDFAALEDYQAAVGGWIEAVDIAALGVTVYVDEEGLLRHMSINTRATLLWWAHVPEVRQQAVLVGDAVVVGVPDRHGESTDIPPAVRDALFSAESSALGEGFDGQREH